MNTTTSILSTARYLLKAAGISVPSSNDPILIQTILQSAYKLTKDQIFPHAHTFRLGKPIQKWDSDDWRSVLIIEGTYKIMCNKTALTACWMNGIYLE